MTSNPRFSVIVSALNEEKVLEGTLKAVLAQNHKSFELIVSDGQSNDRTVDIAHGFTDKVVSSPDVNLGAGRNKGARIARGDILVFVDADTRMPPQTLYTIDRLIRQGAVGGSFSVKWWDGDPMLDFIADLGNLWMMLWQTAHGVVGYGPCMFFDREVFDKVGTYSERVFFEDVEIADRILAELGKRITFVTEHPVYASSRRFRKLGFTRYVARSIKLFYFGDRRGQPPKSYHGQYDMSVR